MSKFTKTRKNSWNHWISQIKRKTLDFRKEIKQHGTTRTLFDEKSSQKGASHLEKSLVNFSKIVCKVHSTVWAPYFLEFMYISEYVVNIYLVINWLAHSHSIIFPLVFFGNKNTLWVSEKGGFLRFLESPVGVKFLSFRASRWRIHLKLNTCKLRPQEYEYLPCYSFQKRFIKNINWVYIPYLLI